MTHVRELVPRVVRLLHKQLTILPREQWLPLEHLGKDAPGTPDIYRHVVLLPREHNFGCAIVPRGDVARHLRVLQTREAEIADFQVTVLVDENVAGFLGGKPIV